MTMALTAIDQNALLCRLGVVPRADDESHTPRLLGLQQSQFHATVTLSLNLKEASQGTQYSVQSRSVILA
jgi:hypothetical protein